MRLSLLHLLIACQAAAQPVNCELSQRFDAGGHHRLLPYLANSVSTLLGRDEVYTPFGPVKGSDTSVEGVKRYVIEYARAGRWEHSQPSSSRLKSLDHLPPVCPQQPSAIISNMTAQSEDCLYLTMYTPSPTLPLKKDLPILVWIHGGSFVSGSGSQPGMDGSVLAGHAEGMIVIMVQYRLGVLGTLPPPSQAIPTSEPNYGLADIKTALHFIRSICRSFGGDPDKITLGGHSSGGQMIRGLLGSTDMQGVFRGAILQSDPMTYGFATPAQTDEIQRRFYASPSGPSGIAKPCTQDDLDCWKTVPVRDLLDAQGRLIADLSGKGAIEGVPLAEVLRPTFGTPSLPDDLERTLLDGRTRSEIPLLISTVASEAGSTIQLALPQPVDANTFDRTLETLFGVGIAGTLKAVPEYDLNNSTSLAASRLAGIDDPRAMLTRIGTDAVWRCPARNFARLWEGDVWVGEWQRGKTYPSNAGGGVCRDGVVCHEDELFPTFGEGPSDLTREAISRWSALVHNLDPNPQDVSERWGKYDGSVHSIHPIGGSADGRPILECPDVWGRAIPFDWQANPSI